MFVAVRLLLKLTTTVAKTMAVPGNDKAWQQQQLGDGTGRTDGRQCYASDEMSNHSVVVPYILGRFGWRHNRVAILKGEMASNSNRAFVRALESIRL